MSGRGVFCAALLLAACGPSGGRGGSGGVGSGGNGADGGGPGGGGPGGGGSGNSFSGMCNGAPTTITGSVKAPNGVDPIASAFVYVPVSTASFPAGVACDLCGMPIDGAAAQAITGPDGSFTLDLGNLLPSAQVAFTVAKGRFRRTGTVQITACHENPIGAPLTVLPGKTGPHDDIPKIAVATGNKDQLDAVLGAMGLDGQLGFDCFEGRKSSTAALTSPCGKRGALPAIETLLQNQAKGTAAASMSSFRR